MSGKATFIRYQKIEAILEADRAVKPLLGPKTELVLRPPNNEKVYFSRPVVYITDLLHEKGDVYTISRSEVLRMTIKLLQDGGGVFKIPASATSETPAVKSPEAKTSTATENASASVKPRPVETKPEPDAKPEPAKAPKKRSSGAKAVTSLVPSETETKISASKAPETAKGLSSDDKPESQKGLPYVYGVAIVSLLMTTDQILEAHDHSAGKSIRQQKVADLIKECQALTVIPNVKAHGNSISKS